MKLPLRSVFLVLGRFGQSLQSLHESFRGWAPQPARVPIPIRAERRTSGLVSRHSRWGG